MIQGGESAGARGSEPVRGSQVPLAVSAVFFFLAAWFLVDSGSGLPEIPARASVAPAEIATTPLRAVLADPPRVEIGGYPQRCSDCHALFPTQPQSPDVLRQHEDVRLDHGLNDRCLNCHSSRDRDKLVLHGEEEIGYDRVVDLCAKCHGPTFRDWQRGTHGKTLGAWAPGAAEARRLICTQCHDPHAPAFDAMPPLPGPRTLRMGERSPEAHAPNPEDASPLVRWLRGSEEAPHVAPSGEDDGGSGGGSHEGGGA